MYTLRRITSEGRESNQILGDSYNILYEWQREEVNQHEYKMLLDPWSNKEEIFGFIIHNKGESVQPLYKKSEYYVMCSDGKTFAKIITNN